MWPGLFSPGNKMISSGNIAKITITLTIASTFEKVRSYDSTEYNTCPHVLTFCGRCERASIIQFGFSINQYPEFGLFTVPFRQNVASSEKIFLRRNWGDHCFFASISLQNCNLRSWSSSFNSCYLITMQFLLYSYIRTVDRLIWFGLVTSWVGLCWLSTDDINTSNWISSDTKVWLFLRRSLAWRNASNFLKSILIVESDICSLLGYFVLN